MRTALTLLCLTVVACSSKETPKAALVAEVKSTEVLMHQLLSLMEVPRQQTDAQMGAGSIEFFARADAVTTLTAAYDATTELWPRWKLIRLAGKSQRPDAVSFLFAEAMKPVEPRQRTAEGVADSVSNEEYVNRLEAALGVVNAMPMQGSSQVEQIIATADISIARILGADLFSLGYLNSALIADLQARGLPTEYRRMSADEERALMTVTPSRWRKQ